MYMSMYYGLTQCSCQSSESFRGEHGEDGVGGECGTGYRWEVEAAGMER